MVRCDRLILKKYKLPLLGAITNATIHCAATPEGKAFKAEQIVEMDCKRFAQPSYHIVVELDGTAVMCLPLTAKGCHVALHNTGNVGISYVGGVDAEGKPKDTRTQAQKATLRRLVAELKQTYPGIRVRGHRDWPKVAKACPCFDVATQL